MTWGKVTAISEADITVELAEINRPEGGGRPEGVSPGTDGAPPRERPSNPPGDRPEGGAPGSRPGGGRNILDNLTFTGEEATYPLTSDVSVQTQFADDAPARVLSDIAVGEVVGLRIDDDGNVSAIVLMPQTDGE
jgi:hypothetical protein